MYCKSILGRRGGQIFVIDAAASIADAAQSLTQKGIGALMVVDKAGALIGILSERDVARAVAQHGSEAVAMPVANFMARDLAVCGLDDRVNDLMAQMNQRRIRHLPVVADGRPIGMVSIRDVVEALLEETAEERDKIRDYVATAG